MASVSSLQGPLEQASAARHDRKTRSHAYLVKRGLRLNMANNPKKVKDPTEVALSAIQEALNISDAPPADNNARGSVHSDATPSASSQDYDEGAFKFNEGTFDTRPGTDRPSFEPTEEPRTTRRAANDDRETIGQL